MPATAEPASVVVSPVLLLLLLLLLLMMVIMMMMMMMMTFCSAEFGRLSSDHHGQGGNLTMNRDSRQLSLASVVSKHSAGLNVHRNRKAC